jgi:hypothetical protein
LPSSETHTHLEQPLIEIHEQRSSDIVTLKLSGIVTRGDISAETAQLERILEERSPLRLYVEMIGFDGFEPGGAWEELKLFFRHRDEISRIAFIVASRKEQWAGWIGEMIATGEAREFEIGEEDQAMAWLKRL